MILNSSSIIPAAAFLLYVAFALFGVFQKAATRVRASFILYMTSMSVWGLGSFLMHANAGSIDPTVWNRVMMVGMLGGPITIIHSLIDLSGLERRGIRNLLVTGYGLYGVLLVLNFTGIIVERAWFEGTDFRYSLGNGAITAYSICYLYLIFALFVVNRRMRESDDRNIRRKLRFPVIGVVVMLVGVFMNLYEPIGRYPVDLFAATVNAIFIFYAIYKYRLVHYSAYVLRIFLFVVQIIVSGFIFYGVLWIATRQISGISFQLTFALALVLGLVAAIVFQPLRKGTAVVIERLYLGKRFDYYKNLRSFSENLTLQVDLAQLSDTTVQKIVETFHLDWTCMFVIDYTSRSYRMISQSGLGIPELDRESYLLPRADSFTSDLRTIRGAKRVVGETFTLVSEREGVEPLTIEPHHVVPLRFRDRVNGCIILGPSPDMEYFTHFDAEILEILSSQCSIAIENAISFERLKRQQKRLQDLNQELTISRNKLEAFFDGITSPIAIQDINYNIVTVNAAAARHFNSSVEDLIGKKCYRAFFGKDKPCAFCMAQDCLHSQLPFVSEMESELTGITLSIQYYPISIPTGAERIFLEFFQDITHQKRLQQELIQSEKLAGIGTLASGIAHEINNPLGGIIGTAEIILDLTDTDDRIREYTTDIIRYSESAAEVIKELTEYSRKEQSAASEVSLIEAAESALKLAGRGMDFANVTVSKDFQDFPEIAANSNELRQIFLNLIMNAVQAMPSGGLLTLSCRIEAGNAVFSVGDTGTGIEEKDIEKLFNPFFTTKAPGRGTGLGLTITHQIVQKLGGRIRIDSRPGVGTTFIITFPLAGIDRRKIRFMDVDSPDDTGDVFFLQRKILVGEKGYLEETIRRTIDDVAFHVVAYDGLQPVGTVSCISDTMADRFPIEQHFDLRDFRRGRRCVEIDRLAVVRDVRGSLIPLGLMTLAYLYAKADGAERVFLDVFSDEKKYISMYEKLGFTIIGGYESPLPVTVMMLDQRTEYEAEPSRMEHFVKPFLNRLMNRIEFRDATRMRIQSASDAIIYNRVLQ